jgi:CRISPR-associated protein Cas2
MLIPRSDEIIVIIAYDISSNRRRQKVADILTDHGQRVNKSVFECAITQREFEALKAQLRPLSTGRKDRIVYYRLCHRCYSRREETKKLPPAGKVRIFR